MLGTTSQSSPGQSMRKNLTQERIGFLKAVVPQTLKPLVDKWANSEALSSDDKNLEQSDQLELANDLAEISQHNSLLTSGILADKEIKCLRDVALTYNNAKLESLLRNPQLPTGTEPVAVNGYDPKPAGHGNTKPREGDDHHTPTAEDDNHTPTAEDDQHTPAAEDDQHTPAAEDDHHTPTVGDDAKPARRSAPDLRAEVARFQKNLFHIERSAFVTRMLKQGELLPDLKQARKSNASAQKEGPPPPNEIRAFIASSLEANPKFNMQHEALSRVLKNPASFSGVDKSARPHVEKALKDLHKAQALAPTPEALPALFQAKISAFRLAQHPVDQFVANFGQEVGGEAAARQIHNHAVRVVARNDHALTSILQAARGTGLAAIDGSEQRNKRKARILTEAQNLPEQIDLEKLFGTLDYCECSDCTSVTSPAAYYVELLQFLRNNNLDPQSPWDVWTNSDSISYSPLDYLFRRRPDLACLELTCANTNTVLPYIDLANEVMESFIVHQQRFASSQITPKQSWIDIFNSADNADGLGGSSAELMAVPENVNMQTYEVLSQAVYPAARLPYNQPIDTIRQFLLFLGTSRAEVMKCFQRFYQPPTSTVTDSWAEVICPSKTISPPPPCPSGKPDCDCACSDNEATSDSGSDDVQDTEGTDEEDSDEQTSGQTKAPSGFQPLSQQDQANLTTIHQEATDMAIAAESLNITQEEFIILTKQAFWPKQHFDLLHGEDIPTSSYRTRIGVKKDWEYWGLDYNSLNDMLEMSEEKQTGLTFVKKQLLPRTGLLYADLVNILKTRYINPNMLQGRAKVIMEKIVFSYQYLALYVDPKAKSTKSRLKEVLEFIENPTDDEATLSNLLKDHLKPKSCCSMLFDLVGSRRNDLAEKVVTQQTSTVHDSKCKRGCEKELRDWVCRYFERVGNIIVLDNGEGEKILFEGDIILHIEGNPPPALAFNPPTRRRLVTTAATAQDPTDPGDYPLGHIHKDGRITSSSSLDTLIGKVSLSGVVYQADGVSLFKAAHPNGDLIIKRTDPPTGKTQDGLIDSNSTLVLNGPDGKPVSTPWTSTYDDCDITKVRLKRLNGKTVTKSEYDKLHRFLRLWRKLGWSIPEVDAAITAFGSGPKASPQQTPTPASSGQGGDVDYPDFQQPCDCGKPMCSSCNANPGKTNLLKGKFCSDCGKPYQSSSSGGDGKNSKKCCSCHTSKPQGSTFSSTKTVSDISPYLIAQVAALKELVTLTGLSLLQLLTFWSNIDTFGTQSLYSQLFLTHNMLGIDRVFAPDADGNYLVQTPTPLISQHLPILLAAFQLKPDDLDRIINLASIKDDQLTLANVTLIYRHALLARILSIKPKDLATALALLRSSSPWVSAQNALSMVKLWNKISTAGFDFRQLEYVFDNRDDDPLRPLGPTTITLLRLASTIYDSLHDIDGKYQPVTEIGQATTAVVTSNAQQLFDQNTVAQIVAFLEGTRVYSTNAPKENNIQIPDNLKTKLKYIIGTKILLVSAGQLTPDEASQAKRLVSQGQDAKWNAAIDRLAKQAVTFFKNYLAPMFPDGAAAQDALTKGDVLPPSDSSDPNAGTPAAKRLYFLQFFIPFLKNKLSDQAVVSTMGSAVSLSNEITAALLQDFLVVGGDPAQNRPGTSALAALEAIKSEPESQTSWSGYLLVNSTDKYTIYAPSVNDDNPPASIMLNGQVYAFETQQDDPSDVWFGDTIRLIGGTLYKLEISDQIATNLMWKTDSTSPTAISSSNLIHDHAQSQLKEILVLLMKASVFISGFTFILDEITYFQKNADFASLDWNKLTIDHWKRLNDYTTLKKSLSKSAKPLLQLFKWASAPGAKPSDIVDQVNQVTLWDVNDITSLIDSTSFNLQDVSKFRNEVVLIKLQKSLNLAKKVGTDIRSFFTWGKPVIRFDDSLDVANNIKTVTRAQFSLSDWEQAIKPTYDNLRQDQSNALVAYLTVQPDLVAQGIIDADSLFEFFLIDPSMCPCMETSRLKQATSSVQLFIQRCLLGLENQDEGFGQGVDLSLLDRDRWNWMQRYRLWEANRKVFLFPENWIQSSLRDDKTPQYKAFESEILQKDINEQGITDAIKNYLFALDEVANLKVFAILVEDIIPKPTTSADLSKTIKTLHFFARTAASPYKYHYRTFDMVSQTWTPWQQMQVDIPNYDNERTGSSQDQTISGCYIVPFLYNGRLIVGLPQLMRKQAPKAMPDKSANEIGTQDKVSDSSPQEYWEIKFGFTELLNGSWKQKVISTDVVMEAPTDSASLPLVSDYQFVPQLVLPQSPLPLTPPVDTVIVINVLRRGTQIGYFAFNGSRVIKFDGNTTVSAPPITSFQLVSSGVQDTSKPWQVVSGSTSSFEYSLPYVNFPTTSSLGSTIWLNANTSSTFSHPFSHALLSTITTSNDLQSFFNFFKQGIAPKGAVLESAKLDEAWGAPQFTPSSPTAPFNIYNELSRTYSIYNWEMAFHIPMALADKLLQMQQFDLALKMCEFVFNPYAKGIGTGRYWQFPPFNDIDSIDSMEKLFSALKPMTSVPITDQINQWRDHPFSPHLLARLRPVAYMKWAVMKYINILIAYGDWYFQQNTLELIPMAIQCYVLASHVYGPRGQMIPKRGTKKAETYLTLMNKWDAFDNAMVSLELDFPFSNQIDHAWGESNGVVGLANIFGFATNTYFCVPNNDQLTAVRDLIDDRLFKIRHCQDIKGVFRQLPLYEPPLDVGQLVSAVAQGLSLTSLLNDLNTSMPNYRFTWILSKALELCAELKSLGAAFLSAKEKEDGEALSLLRQKHDLSIQNLVMEQKKLALQEAQQNVSALQISRRRPVYQMQHALKLLGADVSLVPSSDDDWNEMTDSIPTPVQDSGLMLSPEEAEEMDKALSAASLNEATSIVQTISSELHALPTLNSHASPLGVGVAVCWGPPNIAEVMNGVSSVMRIAVDSLTHQSTAAGRTNSHIRTRQDRIQTANTQGYEIKALDAQIQTQTVRIDICNQEITNQQKQIDNAQEVLDFLTNKYTNQELYTWMEGRVRTLYYQMYQMAYSLARKAELSFQFERGVKNTNFIQGGYWDPGHDGLLSGEALHLSLKTMEAAYHEARGYDFEVSKFVSLRQINPIALMNLRQMGACEFAIPEILFDMDFPGHYLRKIKSVALTIPCVVGPYTTINATLRLTAHKYRFDAKATDSRDYVEKTAAQTSDGGADPRFDTVNIPIAAAAVSTGNNDSGVFDLNFKDERFMPFEGAGAVSLWTLELPSAFRQFDYGSITDVVLHMRYTACDGGNTLRDVAAAAVTDYIAKVVDLGASGSGPTSIMGDGLYTLFDARADFALEWQAFTHPATNATQRVLSLRALNERLPIYTKGRAASNLVAENVWIATDGAISQGQLQLSQGNSALPFQNFVPAVGGVGGGRTAPPGLPEWKWFMAQGPVAISNWDISISDVTTAISRMWVIVRYVMK